MSLAELSRLIDLARAAGDDETADRLEAERDVIDAARARAL